MRPQQQNRRMRGRNNNNNTNNTNNNGGNQNRKGPNPLTRNYESNGPDVKIRGSAQQIAEKYATLARDAHSSGDRVMSENYLQHAEHYNRIIAAAQAQLPVQNFQPQQRDEFDDDMEDEMDGDQPQQRSSNNGDGPQPVIEGVPAEIALTQDGEATGEQPRANNFQNGNNGNGNNGNEAGESPAAGDEQQARRPRRRGRGRGRFEDERGEQVQTADGEQPEARSGEAPEPASSKPERAVVEAASAPEPSTTADPVN